MLMRRLLGLAVALFVVPRTVNAQELKPVPAPHPAITSSFLAEPGVQVEGAGLRHWTLQMIQDSLDVHAPGVTFVSGSCGSELRRLPLFLQAVVAVNAADSAATVFVAVIEPQDSALITVRDFGDDTQSQEYRATRGRLQRVLDPREDGYPSVAPWPELVELGRTRFAPLQQGIIANIQARAAGLEPRITRRVRADSVELTQVWNTLAAHRTAEDADTARRILTTSRNVYDRLAAVAILSNFDGEDATWHALVGALLDPEEMVREYTRFVLWTFTTHLTRPIGWRPAASELHALLQGSDLWSLNETLDMLVATGVGVELAAPLLEDGGHGVMIFAGAKNVWARGPAHRFLRAVSGKGMGYGPEEWREWIASL